MQYTIQNILSNPYLLKDVPEETIQDWINQYPYVALFQLYDLKNKSSYSETDVNKTAFYFNNREKLHLLLNKKDETPKYSDSTFIAEVKQAEQEFEVADVIGIQKDNTKEIEVSEEIIINEEPETLPIVEAEIPKEEKPTDKLDEIIETIEPPISEKLLSEKTEIKNSTDTFIETEQTNQSVEIKTSNATAPLSIADKILAEIKQLRAQREEENNNVESNTKTETKETIPEATPETQKEEEIIAVEKTKTTFEQPEIANTVEETKAIENDIVISPKAEIFIPTTPIVTTIKKVESVEEQVIKTKESSEHNKIADTLKEPAIEINTIPNQPLEAEINISETKAEKKVSENRTAKKEIASVKLDTNEQHTFIEWLMLLDGDLQIQDTPVKKEENWIEIPKYEVQQTIRHKKEIQEEESKLFQPVFEEGEVDLFNEIDEEVTKVATESIRFNEGMMTETLAKIYLKQGKTEKALDIYNHLQLKYPEKSAYFASLIQKLQKEE